jgi:hypothetical protein
MILNQYLRLVFALIIITIANARPKDVKHLLVETVGSMTSDQDLDQGMCEGLMCLRIKYNISGTGNDFKSGNRIISGNKRLVCVIPPCPSRPWGKVCVIPPCPSRQWGGK